MTAHQAELVSFLRRARRRQVLLSIARYGAIGLLLGVLGGLVVWIFADARGLQLTVMGLGIGGLLAGALDGMMVARRTPVALDVERRAPESRNLVLTAAEMLAAPSGARDDVADFVTAQAAAKARSLDLSRIFPARRPLAILAGAAALWLAAIGLTAARDPEARVTLGAAPVADEVGTVEVSVVPPAYTKQPEQRLSNPSRITAIEGSRISLTVRGTGVRVETVEGEVPATGNGFEITARADGFIAIRAGASARRLIGLTVTPDNAPRVRVTAPGKDMFIADSTRRIPVDIDARDDIALSALRLRYTKVSGSGERFTFVEGELPVTLAKPNDREWTAKGTLDLGALGLQRGDMLVYRGAAADGRPGAPLTESDAFIIEITSPLSIAAEGFSLDDQQDKYALSQQMVILKTERLLARAATLPPDSIAYYSQNIAAEQRAVRAEFVFMMGGEVAEEVIAAAGMDIDETKEAENESELAAGRMVNRGRIALVQAIREMSRASALLNNADPKAALPEEKKALVSLQDAFSRTRYLLRALTQRERLDLSRRLTGVLTLAARDMRPQTVAAPDPAVVSLRRALSEIAALANGGDRGGAIRIAQQVLAVDPSDSTLQRVAARLGESRFDDAASELAAALRARLPREAASTETDELRRLRGALNDARRGGR